MSDRPCVISMSRSVTKCATLTYMSRRSFGNVTRLPSGKYRARYTGPDGQMYSAPSTFFDQDDAAAWIRSERKLIEFDEWSPPKQRATSGEVESMTVGEWVQKWLELRTRGSRPLKISTAQTYQDNLDRRFFKATGRAGKLRDIPLTKCTRRDVAEWWDAINLQSSAAPDCRNAYARLRTALGAAVARDLIPANPVDVEDAKKRPKAHRKQLPEDSVMEGIVEQLGREHTNTRGAHKLIAILTLFHGLRIGEALGLRRKDVKITGDTITVHVDGNATRIKGKGMIRQDTPKTDAGNRLVPIFSRFHQDVHYHLKMFVGDSPDAMLFATPSGKIVMDTTFRSLMNAAKRRAGYEEVKITPHYGRVWLITALAEAGMPLPQIGEILGQVDLATITEIYLRASSDAVGKAYKAMNKRLGE